MKAPTNTNSPNPSTSTNTSLEYTLQADLKEDYNTEAALNFLKALVKSTEEHNKKKEKAQKNLRSLFQNPPAEDTTLHVIYKTPYVMGEIVLAGTKTRQKNPLCDANPIHFKKTYLKNMSRWETSPHHVARQTQMIWEHFQESHPWKGGHARIPRPLGASPESFRSTLLEARSLGALSPINPHGDAKETANQILQARTTEKHSHIAKLWEGLENLDLQTDNLHSGGFLHKDLHRENLMLRESDGKYEGCLIDFETSEEDERFGTPEWVKACQEDKRHLHREASLIFLCGTELERQKIAASGSSLSQAVARELQTDPLLILVQKTIKESSPPQQQKGAGTKEKSPKNLEDYPSL